MATERIKKESSRRRPPATRIAEPGGTNLEKGEADTTPKTLAISHKGVTTGQEFAELMSALMSDVVEGRISPAVANAACNAGGKLLKVVEMQYRFGKTTPTNNPHLALTE